MNSRHFAAALASTPKMADVGQEHAVDADIGLINGAGGIHAVVGADVVVQNVANASVNAGSVRRSLEEREVEKRVVGADPLGLVRAATP
jgi:hypothetical protein